MMVNKLNLKPITELTKSKLSRPYHEIKISD